jgi:hypothetical protein
MIMHEFTTRVLKLSDQHIRTGKSIQAQSVSLTPADQSGVATLCGELLKSRIAVFR